MPNPTYEQIRAMPEYADMSDSALQAAYDRKFRGPEIAAMNTGLPQGETGGRAPSMLDRVRQFPKNHPNITEAGLKTAGTLGALALAPETGGLSVPMGVAALGNVAGGLANHVVQGQPEDLGDVGWDAAEGAAGPALGPVLKGAASVGRATGELIPKSAKIFGMFSHPGAVLGLEAATNPKLLPRVLDAAGDGANAAVSKVRGSARGMLGLGEEAAERPMIDTSAPPTTPFKRQPFQEPKPYRMGGEPMTPLENTTADAMPSRSGHVVGHDTGYTGPEQSYTTREMPDIMSETRNAAHMTPEPVKPSSFDALMNSHMPEPELVPEAEPVAQMDVDGAGVNESLAGIDDALGKVPQGKGARVMNRNLTRDTEEQASTFRDAAAHGVKGFSNVASDALSPASRVSSLAELEALMGRMKR